MTLPSTSGPGLLPPHLASAPPARLSARFIALLLDGVLGGLLGLVIGATVCGGKAVGDTAGAIIGGLVGAIIVLWVAIKYWIIALMRKGATPGMRIAGVTWARWSYPDYPGWQGLIKKIIQSLIGIFTIGIGAIIVYCCTRDEFDRFWFDRVTDIYAVDAKNSSLPWGEEPIAVAPAYNDAGSPLAMMGGDPMGGASEAQSSTGDWQLRPDEALRAESSGFGAPAGQAPWQQPGQDQYSLDAQGPQGTAPAEWQQADQTDWQGAPVAPAPGPDAAAPAPETAPSLAQAPDAAEMLASLQAQTTYIDRDAARAAFQGSPNQADDQAPRRSRGAHAAPEPQVPSAPQAPSAPAVPSGAGTSGQWPSPEPQAPAPGAPAAEGTGWVSALQSSQPQAPQTGPEGIPASGDWQSGGWDQAQAFQQPGYQQQDAQPFQQGQPFSQPYQQPHQPGAAQPAEPVQQGFSQAPVQPGYAQADQLAQAYQTGQQAPQAPAQPYQAPGLAEPTQPYQQPGYEQPGFQQQPTAPYASPAGQAQPGLPVPGPEPTPAAPFQAPQVPQAPQPPQVEAPAPQAPGAGAYEAQVAGAAATVVFDRSSAQRAGIGAPSLRLALDTGQVVQLSGTSLIGRAPVAAGPWAQAQPVPVDDPAFSISKTHAVITYDGGRLVIQDLQSTNGTVVVEPSGAATQVLPGMMVPVPVGSTIRLGERTARLEA